jgi:hypothetical protein
MVKKRLFINDKVHAEIRNESEMGIAAELNWGA